MKKRHNMLQSPLAPLFILVVIMMGNIIGGTHKSQSASQEEQIESSQTQEESADEITEAVATPTEEPLTNAMAALKYGDHLTETIETDYASKVVQDYCNRQVIACNSTGLTRYNEENLFRQTFDEMTGYMSLVKISASQETDGVFTITTENEDITAVLVFPDNTYVGLDLNEEITCPMPKGNSTIIYIGKKLSGSIQVEIQENESLILKRM